MVATSTVTASPRSQPEVFYRQTVFRIARSWARVPNAAWDRVKDPLFSQCPHALDYNNESSEIKDLVLGTNDRLSIIGLGLYFLESKGCHGQHIVPYLLWIEDKLLDISFSERQSGRFSNYSFLTKKIRLHSHYSKSQIFVQKFNFVKTLQFSREIKVINN